MSLNPWLFRAIRGFGMFVILYLAIAFVVSIAALFVHGLQSPVPFFAAAIVVVLAGFSWLFVSARTRKSGAADGD